MICRIKDRFFWRHYWSAWEDGTCGVRDRDTGCCYDIKMQTRICKRCNQYQARRIAIEC